MFEQRADRETKHTESHQVRETENRRKSEQSTDKALIFQAHNFKNQTVLPTKLRQDLESSPTAWYYFLFLNPKNRIVV